MINFSTVQIHVVNHCNYTCESCATFSSKIPKRVYEADEYIEVLEKLQTYCTIDTIQLMGGEPTLHPNLIGFISKIRKHTPAKISLITNGWWFSQVDKFEEIIKTVDSIDFSPHPENKLSYEEQYGVLAGIQGKYGTKTFFRYTNYFFVLETTEEFNYRHECIYFNGSSCIQLLPNGLAACYMISLAPEEICSKSFNSRRETGFFDVMQGNEAKLSEWFSKLPEFCNYCTSADKAVRHEWDVKI
jgi:organic radical activating enzyme